jgi:hypothetical protein
VTKDDKPPWDAPPDVMAKWVIAQLDEVDANWRSEAYAKAAEWLQADRPGQDLEDDPKRLDRLWLSRALEAYDRGDPGPLRKMLYHEVVDRFRPPKRKVGERSFPKRDEAKERVVWQAMVDVRRIRDLWRRHFPEEGQKKRRGLVKAEEISARRHAKSYPRRDSSEDLDEFEAVEASYQELLAAIEEKMKRKPGKPK